MDKEYLENRLYFLMNLEQRYYETGRNTEALSKEIEKIVEKLKQLF